MKNLTATLLAAAIVLPMIAPTIADAQRHDRYRGENSRYERCKSNSGTTGTIIGGVGGAVAGNVLGGGTLGTLAGAGGGALLGRHIDKKNVEKQNRRRGC